MDSGAESRLTDVQDLGHFVVAELLGVPKYQRLVHSLREPRERVANTTPPLFSSSKRRSIWSGDGGSSTSVAACSA
jgi:hypothetical protein